MTPHGTPSYSKCRCRACRFGDVLAWLCVAYWVGLVAFFVYAALDR